MKISFYKLYERRSKMNWNRVFAMVLRYFLYLKHNWDRLSDMFYWPAFDLFLWGLTGLYFAKLANSQNAIFVLLAGLVFWIVIWRAQYEINVNILAEIWDKNLVNIFASPLTVKEWITSLLIVGFIKMILSVAFSALIAFILYRFNIFLYGFALIPHLLSLLLTGWAAGFLVASMIIRYGAKIQTFAWTGVAIIGPFSGLYYPLSILPHWAQTTAFIVPSSYVFENLRQILSTGTFSMEKLLISFGLNVVYLIISLKVFMRMFKKSRELGLNRLVQ